MLFFQTGASFKSISERAVRTEIKKPGKIYADVPLNYFASVKDLKDYVAFLKELGVNVLLILPHFKPSFSPYVVADYETPCDLFGTWKVFADFMAYVKDLGMDRMIDIPFNHADWQVKHLKREWFVNSKSGGIEAGADDEDADGKRVKVKWGAYVLDNSNKDLQKYWLEKVIFPHIDKMHVNAIRIDAAWGLDPDGLKTIVRETKKRNPDVWFVAENLGMAKLVKLAESGLEAGADRFFNNFYWHEGGHYIPGDVYRLYKASKGAPLCTIFSSHDTLMPAMKSYAKLRSHQLKGFNNKALLRQFLEREKIDSLSKIGSPRETKRILELMKSDFLLSALMSSDLMFVAGSEKLLFAPVNVNSSTPADFAKGMDTDFPEFMKKVIDLKKSAKIFNSEGVVIPFGAWKKESYGLKGFCKSVDKKEHLCVITNTSEGVLEFTLPRRIREASEKYILMPGKKIKADLPDKIQINPATGIIIQAVS